MRYLFITIRPIKPEWKLCHNLHFENKTGLSCPEMRFWEIDTAADMCLVSRHPGNLHRATWRDRHING